MIDRFTGPDAPRFIIGESFVLPLTSVLRVNIYGDDNSGWSLVAEDICGKTTVLCKMETKEIAERALKQFTDWLLYPTCGRTIEFRHGCDFYKEQVVKRSYSGFAHGFVVDGVDSSPDAGCYYDKEGYCTKTEESAPCKCEGNPLKCNFIQKNEKKQKPTKKIKKIETVNEGNCLVGKFIYEEE